MKISRLIFFFLFLFVLSGYKTDNAGCQDIDSASLNAAQVQYGDWNRIYNNPFYLTNDIWGKGNITDYDQCIFKLSDIYLFPMGWKWRWPSVNTEQVKSYPNIVFGKSPWENISTVSWFPRQIKEITEMTVTYDIAQRATGKYNLSFDLWITQTPDVTNPPEVNVVHEIMIWLDAQGEGIIPNDQYVKRVIIAGEAYKFFKVKDMPLPMPQQTQYKRNYLAFFKETPEYKGNTKIHEFLNYLVKNKHILPTEYFRNISLGNEVWFGSGETVLNDYSISIKYDGKVATTKEGTVTTKKKEPASIITLQAQDAEIKTNAQLKYEEGAGGNIVWWTKTDDVIKWKFTVSTEGEYVVSVRVACDPQFPGSTVGVTVNNRMFTFTVPDTGGWFNYRNIEIGKINLKTGNYTVTVKALKVNKQFVCNLQLISFQNASILQTTKNTLKKFPRY